MTYLANLASFINIARSDNIRVLIALMPLPQHGGYLPSQSAYTTKGSPQYHDLNLYYVDANYLAAQKRYVSDLITGLTHAGANLSDIFSFELIGEVVFKASLWPLNLTSGLVQTDGQAQPYDMADPASRNELIDQNILYWENQLCATIHAALPSTLVSAGFFTPYALVQFPQTPRISRPESSFSSASQVDFVDIHMYSIFGPVLNQISSLGIPASSTTKPIVLGEFGEYFSQAPTPRPQPPSSRHGRSRVVTSTGSGSVGGSPGRGTPSNPSRSASTTWWTARMPSHRPSHPTSDRIRVRKGGGRLNSSSSSARHLAMSRRVDPVPARTRLGAGPTGLAVVPHG